MTHDIPEIKIHAPSPPSSTNADNTAPGDQRLGCPDTVAKLREHLGNVDLSDYSWKIVVACTKALGKEDDWTNHVLAIGYGSPDRANWREDSVVPVSFGERPSAYIRRFSRKEHVADSDPDPTNKKEPFFCVKHVEYFRSPVERAFRKKKRKLAKHSSSLTGTSSLFDSIDADADPVANDDAISLTSPLGQKSARENEAIGDRSNSVTQVVQTSSKVSYAVAILPYTSEYEGGLYHVLIDESFKILSRDGDSCLVERDDKDASPKQISVPAMCLLETRCQFIAAVMAARFACDWFPLLHGSPPRPISSETPILATSISSPLESEGVALLDYKKKEVWECDLVKDDLLNIYKHKSYWFYVVNNLGERGWVPSWLVGKKRKSKPVPSIPSDAIPAPWTRKLQPPRSRLYYKYNW